MRSNLRFFLLFLAAIFLANASAPLRAAEDSSPKYTDPQKADADYALQGEYEGSIGTNEGDRKFGVQVVALGDGKFLAAAYSGGLPGAGWDGSERITGEGEKQADGTVLFRKEKGQGELSEGQIVLRSEDGNVVGKLTRVERKSPTLGQKPPENATVLFDGSNVEAWENGRLSEDGYLQAGVTSRQKFGSHTLHIEFLLPYQPFDRGQGRGNSGIYLQGRYEVQMLDSFGLTGEQNECGGIYSVARPRVNMCLPPLVWQTYDIDYTAAKYDDAGQVVANPRITVRHNGVLIHEDQELPADRSTTAAPVGPGPEPGPVYLQDHGTPVQYRNIWVVEKE